MEGRINLEGVWDTYTVIEIRNENACIGHGLCVLHNVILGTGIKVYEVTSSDARPTYSRNALKTSWY